MPFKSLKCTCQSSVLKISPRLSKPKHGSLTKVAIFFYSELLGISNPGMKTGNVQMCLHSLQI